MQHYSLVTRFSIEAPLEKVWDVLMDFQLWGEWWKGVKHISVEKKGDFHLIHLTIGYLFYNLKLVLETNKIVEGKSISFICGGDLVGSGRFLFEKFGKVTTVDFRWEVDTTKHWMNVTGVLVKPLFEYSHHVVMRWFVDGVAKQTRGKIIDQSYFSIPA